MNRAELRRQILTCTRCELHTLANGPVPFRGPRHPELLVIGEAPGRWEDRARKPFVGPSGSLIGRYLAQAGFDVTDRVAFTNTCMCWPNRNKQTPTWPEVDACVKNLDDQIDYFAPEMIALLGMTATTPFWPNLAMKQLHGRWFTVKGIPTMATYHPAAVLRDPGLGPVLFEDLEVMRIGPTLTAGHINYQCVICEADAEVWVSEGRDVTETMGGLGIGWCIRHLRMYRRKYRGAGGGAVQLSLEHAEALRDEAMDAVENGAGPEWNAEADAFIEATAEEMEFFAADDVWAAGLSPAPNDSRAIGPALTRAAEEYKIIVSTGEYRKSRIPKHHAKPLTIWKSLIYGTR